MNIRVDDLAGLKACLAEFGEDVLFRGQTQHYGPANRPSATTSFDRHGCIPTEMLRWGRYADEVLGAFTGQHSDLALNQAILQHYGWRSFYLDCSGEASVSAWFAGNRYSDKLTAELCEDCDERPLFLRKKMASYEAADGVGHLYVLDRAACQAVGLTDLTAIALEGARTRASVQRAYLLGPLRNAPLPAKCFVAHIEADCATFREFAAEAGLVSTGDVFPPSTEDPILDALLSLPWIPIPGVENPLGDIPAFRRGIELPEYDDSFVKIASPVVAFYRGGKIEDFFDQVDGFSGGIGVQVPEITLFGSPDRGFPRVYPKVMQMLREHGGIVFEAPTLVKFPQHAGGLFYQKGLALDLVEPDLVHLGALMVRHPGQEIDAVGVDRGWYHRVGEDGVWRREPRDDDCPCGTDWPHERHLASLCIVEHFLAEPAEFDD
ncbi:hypothetical protein [Sphingobium sp. GW456-12-10-14-TSB1]|uniref:hypothetical protein n=2 Tax=unclassified Sphingobium TaxID=2611147 RepID=UPI001C3CBC6D|nr:hypothetical protein [Sphingobium sp. GW456-12-10-14-TSB1]